MKMSVQMANFLGEQLYVQIRDAYDSVSVQACKDAGLWSPLVTAGKMTGMILEGHTEAEVRAILADSNRLADLMVQCVEAFCAYEKNQTPPQPRPAPPPPQAGAPQQTVKAAWSALISKKAK